MQGLRLLEAIRRLFPFFTSPGYNVLWVMKVTLLLQYPCVMQTLHYLQQTTSRKCKWGATEIVQIAVLSTICTAHLTSKRGFINKVVFIWNSSSVCVEWQMGHLVCVCVCILAEVLQTTVNWQWLSANEWQRYMNNFLLWTQLISVGSICDAVVLCLYTAVRMLER